MIEVPEGITVIYDQQAYRLLGSSPYVTKAGNTTALLDWETECPRCGETFATRTPLVATGFVRRCEPCRRATRGGRISSMRKKLRQQLREAGATPDV